MIDEIPFLPSEDDEEEAAQAESEALARQQRRFDEERALRDAFIARGGADPLNAGAYDTRERKEVPKTECRCGEETCTGYRPDPRHEKVGEEMLQPSVTPQGGSSSKGRNRESRRSPSATDLRQAHDNETAYRTDYGAQK